MGIFSGKRELKKEMAAVESETGIPANPREPWVTPMTVRRRIDEANKLKRKMNAARSFATKLRNLSAKFARGLGRSKHNLRKQEKWKRDVIMMEHQASELWYKMAESLAEVETLGVELVATIEAEKRYQQEFHGSPQRTGLKQYENYLRTEMENAERTQAARLSKKDNDLEKWWDEEVAKIEKEQRKSA